MERTRKTLRVSITEKEYQKVKEGYAVGTCRNMSEYVKNLMFGGKINVCYRDRAFDDFIEESIRLKKALILFSNQGGFDERERMNLLEQIEEIRSIIIKISETYSQM